MTEEYAIAQATEYLKASGIPHAEFVEARLLLAEQFNRLYGRTVRTEDFWVVEYMKVLEEGVLIESPPVISVVVHATSGRAELLESP